MLFFFAQSAPALPGPLAPQLVVLGVLLVASALFSGSEVALFSLDAADRQTLVEQADRAGSRVLTLLDEPRQVLVTILVLNTVVNVGIAILSSLILDAWIGALVWPEAVTFAVEVVSITFVLLVVSEITPKLIASRHALGFSRFISGFLLTFHRALRPVSDALAHLAEQMQRLFKRWLASGEQRISSDDLKAMAEIGEAHGTLEEEERELIHSIVEFGEMTAREVMVSRLDVNALPLTASLHEAFETIRTGGHSRLPLYDEHLDNIRGVVYAKDLLPYLDEPATDAPLDWARLARPPMFVPLGKKLDDLMRDFQARKTHMAIVVDEYGGTAGLVTMEDLLEEIVGDIRDEHDEDEEAPYEEVEAGVYRVDARLNLDDLDEVFADYELPTEDFDFETLGGLIYHVAGDIPAEGDEVDFERLRMEVESIENHRIVSVLVQVRPPEDLAAEPTATDEPPAVPPAALPPGPPPVPTPEPPPAHDPAAEDSRSAS